MVGDFFPSSFYYHAFREVKVVCFSKLAMHVTVLIQYQIKSGFPFLSQADIKILFVLITKAPRSLFSVACMALRMHEVGDKAPGQAQ